MKNIEKNILKLFVPCYFAFFVNGAMVLAVGAILPYIIEEAGLSYSIAGGLLSTFAIGNLLASFVNPLLTKAFGKKTAIGIGAALIPLSWYVIQLLPAVPIMYAAFIFMGIGRGSVSIINNAVVNDNSDGKPKALNLLHMTFAIGAFLSPFLTSMFIKNGLGWRAIVYTLIIGTLLSLVGFMTIDFNYEVKKASAVNNGSVQSAEDKKAFYKNVVFYINGFLLFLYLGLENCVNGWFVTYFKSMGIMSASYAANLVSITWVMVMAGRLITAKISGRVNKNKLIMIYCIATAVFFTLLTLTQNLMVITIAIAGLGAFFAGIYPTCVASAGSVIKGNNTAMSMLLALAALGGIITPQLIGIIADKAGMTSAILLLFVNAAGMVILSIVNVRKNIN